MFDISFTEMVVIGVVALVVLGPERLPGVARTLGHLFGRAQRYVNNVKNDIQREMELEELKKFKTSVEGTAHSIETSVRTEIRQFQEAMEGVETRSSSTSSIIESDTVAENASPSDSTVTPANKASSSAVSSKSNHEVPGAASH
ncbi:Sec-independent protein translocase protein TatB [Nitrosovibrio tenuis]|uniref:Sec-independent protein translocase protein TatB n=1 Tax=Nitrosovibrio tenuis TaxID=1233 RepID=A0A1H7K7E3_9PROT|nr:Sec-independent protein translocase protein TatB [Nitrosovibrio tenuis]SEK82474.1 Sec-independent protein translocase TatB [Nitrosovibrio tenuis]